MTAMTLQDLRRPAAATGLAPGLAADLAADLAEVQRPIGQARGLPNETYVGEGLARFERDHVLARTWTCIGFGIDVPAPGDVRPLTLAGLPLILLRDRQNRIAVFHNVCSHRGVELVESACSGLMAIRCPYHAWLYDLTGRLVATPHIGGPRTNNCEGFDKSRHGLKPVRTEVWMDLVFVDISGEAPDFATWTAPLRERWRDFDIGLIRHSGADSSCTLEVQCNWKLAVENYCESYHLPTVHPGLNRYSRLDDHYNIAEPGCFAGQGSRVYNPILVPDGPDLPCFPDLPAKWDRAAEYVALFPNVLLGIHRDHFFAMWLEPVAVDRTVEHLEIYYIGEGATDARYAAARAANLKAWRTVFEEDIDVVQRMQRGRRSPAFTGGVFSPVMDPPTHCFHRWMAERLSA
jgi:choline monooxygenase